jgi:hypothetical protein
MDIRAINRWGRVMASIRTVAFALTLFAAGLASLSDAAAQSFSRCPKSEQHADVIKVLTSATDRSRAMAEDNPLLLADVGFYETELAATRRCVPAVAAVRTNR